MSYLSWERRVTRGVNGLWYQIHICFMKGIKSKYFFASNLGVFRGNASHMLFKANTKMHLQTICNDVRFELINPDHMRI